MGLIISSIEELRATVKVSTSLPFDVVKPFLSSARDLFLVRYLGVELVEVLEGDEVPERATKLLDLVKKSLGPLAVWIGGAELSVRISDSGMTVEKNQDKFLPASDAKISNVADSLERRGFQYLDMAISYIWNNIDQFPEWSESNSYLLRNSTYLRSPEEFQEKGLVNIEYSWLTFETVRPLIALVEERFITDLIGETLDTELRDIIALKIPGTDAKLKLIAVIRKIIACKTAELFTSQASNRNRTTTDTKEYKPLIRPAYGDITNTGNFYAEQAAYYLAKVQQTLNKYAEEFGITPVTEAPEFNDEDKHIFFAG